MKKRNRFVIRLQVLIEVSVSQLGSFLCFWDTMYLKHKHRLFQFAGYDGHWPFYLQFAHFVPLERQWITAKMTVVCLLWDRRSFSRNMLLLESHCTQRIQDGKKRICENAVKGEMKHTRIWEALKLITDHVCIGLGIWQDGNWPSRVCTELAETWKASEFLISSKS